MSSVRENTIFVDFSVLPTRPPLESIQSFVEKRMGLNPAGFKCLQLHNTRKGVLIEMADLATATKAAEDNNMKHAIRSGEKCFRIPVYVEDGSVDVRVHDLPPGLPNQIIADEMAQYGEVLAITDEVWKNFFVGIPNGVRVLRMKLSKPVPSYVNIQGHQSMASHTAQTPTCRRCCQKIHPNKTCTAASSEKKSVNSNKKTKPTLTTIVPSATATTTATNTTTTTTTTTVANSSKMADDGFKTVEKKKSAKRQLSIESKTTPEEKRCQVNLDSETEMDEDTLK